MHPKDLLNLARTSKAFRALLMSKSSKSLWLASMKCVEDLPKCPPYMDEPTFINLLFFPHCHVRSPNSFDTVNEIVSTCKSCNASMRTLSHIIAMDT